MVSALMAAAISPKRLRRVIDPLWGALIVCLAGCCLYTLPHLRERARAKQELQKNCQHAWFHFEAMNDPSFPMRQCRTCGKQEMMDRCTRCGKTFERRQKCSNSSSDGRDT
jgi:hypothetical protein